MRAVSWFCLASIAISATWEGASRILTISKDAWSRFPVLPWILQTLSLSEAPIADDQAISLALWTFGWDCATCPHSLATPAAHQEYSSSAGPNWATSTCLWCFHRIRDEFGANDGKIHPETCASIDIARLRKSRHVTSTLGVLLTVINIRSVARREGAVTYRSTWPAKRMQAIVAARLHQSEGGTTYTAARVSNSLSPSVASLASIFNCGTAASSKSFTRLS